MAFTVSTNLPVYGKCNVTHMSKDTPVLLGGPTATFTQAGGRQEPVKMGLFDAVKCAWAATAQGGTGTTVRYHLPEFKTLKNLKAVAAAFVR